MEITHSRLRERDSKKGFLCIMHVYILIVEWAIRVRFVFFIVRIFYSHRRKKEREGEREKQERKISATLFL